MTEDQFRGMLRSFKKAGINPVKSLFGSKQERNAAWRFWYETLKDLPDEYVGRITYKVITQIRKTVTIADIISCYQQIPPVLLVKDCSSPDLDPSMFKPGIIEPSHTCTCDKTKVRFYWEQALYNKFGDIWRLRQKFPNGVIYTVAEVTPPNCTESDRNRLWGGRLTLQNNKYSEVPKANSAKEMRHVITEALGIVIDKKEAKD